MPHGPALVKIYTAGRLSLRPPDQRAKLAKRIYDAAKSLAVGKA
jgi:hypothetical protein